jgi:alpha/beta superfamily hydrolase
VTVDRAIVTSATSIADDGSVERAEFTGKPGDRVFTYLHRPASTPRGAVLICSPLHGEFTRNYRREVLLARALARHGLAALRFHYRFTGNSDGDGANLTFESMRDDALAGLDRLRAEVPSVPLFLVGTRWGALVAASAAAAGPDVAVVLWEPLLDSSRFFKEAFRRRLVRDVRRDVEAPASGRALETRLEAGEGVDVVAHRIDPALYRSALGRTLEAELGSTPRHVLVVQVTPTGSVRPDLGRLLARWDEADLRVDVEILHGDHMAWLGEDRFEDEAAQTRTHELIDLTARWISERVEGAS